MAKLSSLSASPIKHVLIFGPPKCGKTYLAGLLGKHKKLLWFDLEGGYSTLFQFSPEIQDNIELIAIPDNRGTPMAIETMLKVIKGGKVNICEKHGKVTCPLCTKDSLPIATVELNALDKDWAVVIDSGTQLTNSAIAHITKLQAVDYKLDYDDWAHLGKLMDTFLSYVQTASFNVVYISHELAVKMVDGTEKLVPVSGTSNFSRNTAKYFDEVIYGRIVNGSYTFTSNGAAENKILVGSRANIDMKKDKQAELIDLWGAR